MIKRDAEDLDFLAFLKGLMLLLQIVGRKCVHLLGKYAGRCKEAPNRLDALGQVSGFLKQFTAGTIDRWFSFFQSSGWQFNKNLANGVTFRANQQDCVVINKWEHDDRSWMRTNL